jgi:hypothetical protein
MEEDYHGPDHEKEETFEGKGFPETPRGVGGATVFFKYIPVFLRRSSSFFYVSQNHDGDIGEVHNQISGKPFI